MSLPGSDDRRVAITGKLVSMTRSEAAALLRRRGCEYQPRLTRQTTVLVVGEGGLPLRKDGRLSRRLQRARRLQQTGHPITILSEHELLACLGVDGRCDGVHRLYTAAQIAELVGASADQIRAWLRGGLLQPVESADGVDHFDYQQVVAARRICELIRSGVKPARVLRSLRQLQGEVLPAVQESAGNLLERRDDGQLADPAGQLYFDFAEQAAVTAGQVHAEPGAAEWFEQGCRHEQACRLDEAAEAYRRALARGGASPDACFNLGNVLAAQGRKEAATERYRQAVELEPNHVDAWNNLGAALEELGQVQQAQAAYENALKLCPGHADAHYNLADLLDKTGRAAEAQSHWRAYLRREAVGQWADHARRRVSAERS
jgi:tetratricopeptide (TPR) repeat protein